MKCMIKKLLILFISLFVFVPFVLAETDWSNTDNIDNAWDGQKTITNKQFEETMDALQAKSKRKEAKKREKALKKFKGSSLTPQMDAHNDEIVNEQPTDKLEENQLITIPVNFVVNGELIECGYYKIVGEKKDDGVYILLYQAHQLKARLKAKETNDDFNEDYITFAKVLPCNDHQMKIIFGCVDFNAFVYITFVNSDSIF